MSLPVRIAHLEARQRRAARPSSSDDFDHDAYRAAWEAAEAAWGRDALMEHLGEHVARFLDSYERPRP